MYKSIKNMRREIEQKIEFLNEFFKNAYFSKFFLKSTIVNNQFGLGP